MGRPDLTEERTVEILDAFARCVARQGLAATSMQEIADEAGMKRPILRHYVGNRADLVTALAEHVARQCCEALDALVASLPASNALETALKHLFPSTPAGSPGEILVIESLIAAAAEDETVRAPMTAYVDHAMAAFDRLLASECPRAPRASRQAAAYGILSVWFNYSSLTPLRPPPAHRRHALRAARALVDSLT